MTSKECSARRCTFTGPIPELRTHLAESEDKSHSWSTLGHENLDEFSHTIHLDEANRLENHGEKLRDRREFKAAVEALEGALHHYQRAQLFGNASTLKSRRAILNTIVTIETEDPAHVINDLVTTAENAYDTGNQHHFEADSEAAANAYEKAITALEDAASVASHAMPDREETIPQRLRSVRIRRQCLDLAGTHQDIRHHTRLARQHATAGDQFFHKQEYSNAITEYEEAQNQYGTVLDLLDDFSFGRSTSDFSQCDVCREEFSEQLGRWELSLDSILTVCPSCIHFKADGILPLPRDITREKRIIAENIDPIQNDDVGLDWTATEQSHSSVLKEAVNNDGPGERDLLMELIQLYQTNGRPPTAADLD